MAIALVLIGGALFYFYNFATAESRVRKLCSQIHLGMSIDDLRKFASSHGLGPVPRESGVSHIVERRTFGRYGCKVTVNAGLVEDAAFSFAD